jgi:uncharacterized protein (TIGR03435 family)
MVHIVRNIVASALLILLFIAPPPRLRVVSAQSGKAPPQRYEVASVKPCPSTTLTQAGESAQFTLDAVRPVYQRIERTRVGFYCLTVESLIHMAYNGGHWGHRNAAGRDVLGGPSWIRSERYTIEGSADGVANPDLMGAMMRTFLEERFQLRVQRKVDNVAMYALKVARGGLKIKPMAPGDCVAASGTVPSVPPQAPETGQTVPCGTFQGSMNGTLHTWNLAPATLKTVANLFDLDRHVIDKTGVKDRFVIHFEHETAPPGAPIAAVTKELEQQLGLTLVSTKGKRSWVQIERVERPLIVQ